MDIYMLGGARARSEKKRDFKKGGPLIRERSPRAQRASDAFKVLVFFGSEDSAQNRRGKGRIER